MIFLANLIDIYHISLVWLEFWYAFEKKEKLLKWKSKKNSWENNREKRNVRGIVVAIVW